MNYREKITNEDINLLKEMKENCLKASVYKDEKRLLKANAITKFLVEHQEKQELIDYLKEKIKEQEHKLNTLDFGLDIVHTRSYIMAYKEILSKIEKSDN